jgi:hypothetical protein
VEGGLLTFLKKTAPKRMTTSAPSSEITLAPTTMPTLPGGNVTLNDESKCGQKQGDFDQQSWVIAVLLAVFAALLNNLGVNLQKLAWTKKQSSTISPSVYRTYWLLGMSAVVMASVFDFVALAFGPQSVIAPLGALTMVANAFIAPWMHGEKLHPSVLKATAVIIVGCAMSVAAASHSNNICDVDSLFSLYFTGRFAIYICLVAGSILSIIFFIRRAEGFKAELGEESVEYQKVFRFHRLSYAAVSGIFGAQSVLFARTVDLLFVGSTRHGGFFLAYPGTYMVVFCLVSSIVLQIYWLNQGLARFESLYNVPIFTSTWIVGTVLGGGVFYGEFADFNWLQAILFPLGVILCCVGVFFLSRETETDNPQTQGIHLDEDEEVGTLGSGKNGARVVDDDSASQNGEDTRRVDLLGLPQKGSKKAMVFT